MLKGAVVEARAGIDHARDRSNAIDWGWLPALSVTGALGLLLIALADAAAWNVDANATTLFWLGILTLVVPIAARLMSVSASRRERIGLVVLLGLAMYFAKILQSPVQFTFVDELQHWRTAADILQSQILFLKNPILPVGPYFPGLELATAAVANLTGLGIFEASIIVLGVARLVLVLSLYLLYELVSGSPRVAGIAALVYMCNQSFMFFSAVFAYESLALPFAVLTIYAIAKCQQAVPRARLGFNLAAVLALGAVIITHHLTSYALTAFLVLWTIIAWMRSRENAFIRKLFSRTTPIQEPGERGESLPNRHPETAPGARRDGDWRHVGGIALLAFVAAASWLIFAANLTIDYLAPPFLNALTSLVKLITGELTSRTLFVAGTFSAPVGERIVAYGSVGLTLLMLLLGLFWTWKHYRARTVALVLAAAALAYPVILPFRLTTSGAVLSNRSISFVFLAVAFVVAVGAVHLRLPGLTGRVQLAVLAAGATILFTGGVVLGWPESWRLPGPFLVTSHTRSVEPQGVAAAQWAISYLGSDNRMAADWINAHLMGSYGHQDMENGLIDGVNVAPLFFSPSIGSEELAILRGGDIRYLVIDRRLSTALPLTGWYVLATEPNANHYTQPIDLALLDKFDQLTSVSRLFDSGDIAIYDVGKLTDEP